MIRRALLAMAAWLCFGHPAVAADLTLWVDPDGTTYLYNTASSPVWFDGYQIASETNRLDPAGWISIADQVAADPFGIIPKLGAGALSFGEANPGPGNLAELNLGGVGVLQPGAKFAIGKPFLDGQPGADFFYRGGILPEPSTWLLAAMAGLGLLAFRGQFRR